MIIDGFPKESLLLVILSIVSYTTVGLNLLNSDMVHVPVPTPIAKLIKPGVSC